MSYIKVQKANDMNAEIRAQKPNLVYAKHAVGKKGNFPTKTKS